MKESENSKMASTLILGCLALGAGCIGYVILRQWVFLVGGIIGPALIALILILRK